VRRTEWWQEFEADGRYHPDLDAAIEAADPT